MEEDCGLSFDSTITTKEAKSKLHINIKNKGDSVMQNQRKAFISFNGYKNLLYVPGISFCTHEGKYAIKIKSYIQHSSIPKDDLEEAYKMCQDKFFEMALDSAQIFGFETIETSGRSNGYIRPMNKGYMHPKAIDAVNSERTSFTEYIQQQKIEAYAMFIKENLRNIEMFYKYSTSIEELSNLLEKSSAEDLF